MSRENVETVRSLYASFDQAGEAFWDRVPPGMVFDFSRRLIDPVVLRGREEVRAFAERESDTWEGGNVGWEPIELSDAGEKVLALIRTSGRGKASGVDVEAYVWNVWTFQNGEPVEWTYFGEDRAAAIAAMSQNLELVRSIYAAWERGDFSSAEWAHPEIEFVVPDGPDPGSWKGLAEMTESWRSQVSAWEAFRAVADEFRQLDDERVLVLSSLRGRGKTSALAVGQKGAELFHIRDGKVTRLVTYWERERALADLGLAPERDTPS
jgi:ketosteroid isomerase-like protein